MSLPHVSIYVPTRNRRALLSRALDSILAQTYRYFEIIVVDDGSTDDTSSFLGTLADNEHIRVFRFESPRGAQAARNHALAKARFDLVTGLDDDDEWLPDRLWQMMAALRPGVGFVAASDIVERSNGTRYLARRPARITHDMLLCRNVVGNQVLARKADILACGGFDESLPASQDYDLWIRLSTQTRDGVGLAAPLQILHAQIDRMRISTSRRRKHGIWRVYRKYRAGMTRAQRKSHLFNLIRVTNRGMTWRTARALWSRSDAARILAHLLRQRHLLTDGWVERVASIRDRRSIETAIAALSGPATKKPI